MAWLNRQGFKRSTAESEFVCLDCVLNCVTQLYKSEIASSQTLRNGIHILVAAAGTVDHQFRAIGQGGTEGFKPGKGVGRFQRWDDSLQPTDRSGHRGPAVSVTAPYSARPISRR